MTKVQKTGTASNSEEWSGVALPLVRRIFGELAAQDFVSVQPMNLPSGLIFYLDFKYGTAQTGQHSKVQDVHGNTSASNADASGGLYGAGKFGYSANDKSSAAINAAVQLASNFRLMGRKFEFEPALSASAGSGSTATNPIFKLQSAKTSVTCNCSY